MLLEYPDIQGVPVLIWENLGAGGISKKYGILLCKLISKSQSQKKKKSNPYEKSGISIYFQRRYALLLTNFN